MSEDMTQVSYQQDLTLIRHAIETGRWSAYMEDNVPERKAYLEALDRLGERATTQQEAEARHLRNLHDWRAKGEQDARAALEIERDRADRLVGELAEKHRQLEDMHTWGEEWKVKARGLLGELAAAQQALRQIAKLRGSGDFATSATDIAIAALNDDASYCVECGDVLPDGEHSDDCKNCLADSGRVEQ